MAARYPLDEMRDRISRQAWDAAVEDYERHPFTQPERDRLSVLLRRGTVKAAA